jgi:hypothetical protein
MRIYTVYALVEDETVRYVGITKSTLKNRLKGHKGDIKRNRNPRKCEWIKRMISEGKEIIIKPLFEFLTREEAINLEIELISKYENLLNNTTGGEHFEVTDEVKERLSNIQKKKYKNGFINPMLGKSRNDLVIINKNRGSDFYKKLGEENRNRFKEKYNTPEFKESSVLLQSTRIEINQYDLDGNFIKKWPSINSIEKEMGFYRKFIYKCLRGKSKNAYKFKWEYA